MLKCTVVLRSYNRVTACCEALQRCLEQDYGDFEVLVLEQSQNISDEERRRLHELAADDRVQLVFREPLGGPGSRNEACRLARGDVIVMLDDDDIPASPGWLSAFMRDFEDPRCLAVTGRHVVVGGADPPYANMKAAVNKLYPEKLYRLHMDLDLLGMLSYLCAPRSRTRARSATACFAARSRTNTWCSIRTLRFYAASTSTEDSTSGG
jgi:glycosyltransferase involved in cell wall biosynthesis